MLITFQIFWFWAYFDKNLDKYQIKKKNKKELIEAPSPNKIFWFIRKFFEKFPRKNTVSE